MNNELYPIFIRLVQNLKRNASKKNNVTVFLGAGCSLTSSSKDITTYGIIKSLVKQYSMNETITDSWSELYKCFVNNIWEGQGTYDRIQLLEDFFVGMEPSVGYKNLRWLVENHYVNQIITTNFDLMIDKVMEGLSYNLTVGSHKKIIGNNPTFSLIKVHGDLQFGDLRFAPSELSKLPSELENEVRNATNGVVLVVGYRGQDIGVLNALDSSDNHSAFWTSPNPLDQMDMYVNGYIFTWMRNRNSINNFLYGENFGKFDQIFNHLRETLIKVKEENTVKQDNFIGITWRKCSLFDYFQINHRFLQIFDCLHQLLFQKVQNQLWRATHPFYASNCETLLLSAINLIQESTVPSLHMTCITNEVDALLFSFAYSIHIICQGYPYSPEELVEYIKNQYIFQIPDVRIGENFWQAALELSNASYCTKDLSLRFNEPLFFSFDTNNNLQTVLKHININGMHRLLELLHILSLFVQTSAETGSSIVSLQQKQILEKHLYTIDNCDGFIHLQMSTLDENVFQDIFNNFLSTYFSQNIIDNVRVLYHDPIRVDFIVKKSDLPTTYSIWDSLIQQAETYQKQFFANFALEYCIEREYINVFQDFLNSLSTGLFLIGESGSGKTISLQTWLHKLDPCQYVVYPVLGRYISANQECCSFFSFIEHHMQDLNIMLMQRDQTLLLVVDAINEISAAYTHIADFYLYILDLCNRIAKEQWTNIKIVLSCRSDFYYQMKKSCNRSPSSSSFYPIISKESAQNLQTVFTIPLLTEKEIKKFTVKFNLNNKRVEYYDLIKKYGQLVYLPMNLKIICEAYRSFNENSTIEVNDIYEHWFDNIISLAFLKKIPSDTLWAIIFKVIECYYFSHNDNRPQTYRLLGQLSAQNQKALEALEWLIAHKIFIISETDPNLIQFSHDRLEEFFLQKYLTCNYSNNLHSITQYLTDDGLNKPIVRHSLIEKCQTLFAHDKLTFLNTIVIIIREGNVQLITIWINAILQIANHSKDQILRFFRELEQYLLKKEFKNFINMILLHINQEFDELKFIGLVSIELICDVVQHTNCNEDLSFKVFGEYLLARHRYLFAAENEKMAFQIALLHCTQAEEWLSDSIPDSLKDNIYMLKALLLQNQGYLNEAIVLMEGCYQRQKEHTMYDIACQSALALGAMYREMTRFDDAINLYDSIDTSLLSNQLLYYRLCMQKGIIYKNAIQNAIFSGEIISEKNNYNYEKSFSYFSETCKYAEKTDNVSLLLKIYAELVELSCVAFYMDKGTIADATLWVNKIDNLIPRYYVPVERIQCHRMWARVLELKHDYSSAIEHLEQGFTIAIGYNIPFRAADCCNQITGIICTMLNKQEQIGDELLEKGIEYGEYAIKYYSELNNPTHRYLQDSLKKYNKIANEKEKRKNLNGVT